MAARLVRLPRLTLFSGPNCSLCDIAKAELAKVRQTRPFELETVNIQDPGQEKWKKKYVYWIPALHLEGKEIAKGRSGQLAEAEREHGYQSSAGIGNIAPDLFFVDTGTYANWQPNGIYVRASETILGDEGQEPSSADVYLSTVAGPACFNCGEPTHLVSACPKPIDRQLVSLSRDLRAFLKAERGAVDYKRIHEVEEWRQQRLEFLDIFEPGEIRGAALRDALGGQDGDWLENMAHWGYPKGWVGSEDPRDRVREIIWSEYTDKDNEVLEDFFIYIDDSIVEKVGGNGVPDDLDDEESISESENEETEHETVDTSPSPPQPQFHPIRWATYPPSHFSSQLLPVYNGFMLPPVSHQGSSTFTAERHALWQKIISGKYSPPLPPPPDIEPPPLPPPLPLESPPPFPRPPSPSATLFNNLLSLVPVNDLDDEDMEISDVD
ncbi:hypothetical protein C0993_005899 [Termitomyces sp. T159_Od127]|nr:hypothetical protein C0993_005899 [Termitomyces sp. T159_Od127]